jgi:hypothetical protein
MQYLKGLISELGSLITSTGDENGMSHQLRTPSHSRHDAEFILPSDASADIRVRIHSNNNNNSDDFGILPEEEEEQEEQEEEEDVPLYETEEEANRACVKLYSAYMTNYYGRPPRYRSDLFCGMFPIDIFNRHTGETTRYWWLSVTHPVAKKLTEHFLRYGEAGCEDSFDSPKYGACTVYRDEAIEFFVDTVFELFKANGVDLEDVRSTYAQRQCKPETVVNFGEVSEEDIVKAEQNSLSAFSSVLRRTEDSKKSK